jgi:cytochrome bd ubiquinol oxidase subunit I
LHLANFWTFLFNPWAFWQYAHTMVASVVTASFVLTAWGAYWLLRDQHVTNAKIVIHV